MRYKLIKRQRGSSPKLLMESDDEYAVMERMHEIAREDEADGKLVCYRNSRTLRSEDWDGVTVFKLVDTW